MQINRFIILLIACLLTKYGSAQSSAPSADKVLNEAFQLAGKEKKNVFVIFHASWCGWCHKMDKSMTDESCKDFFENSYVIRHLVVDESSDKKNLENPGADDLRNKYGGKDNGIPYWLIFDSKGKLLADSRMKTGNDPDSSTDNSGCPASEKEVAYFVSIIRKTAKPDQQQLAAIVKRFRENEQ